MRFQVEPIISTGLQPGGWHRDDHSAASAALFHWENPLKRLIPDRPQVAGLKPGANGKPRRLSQLESELE